MAVRLSGPLAAFAELDVPLRLACAGGSLDVTARELVLISDGGAVRECRLDLDLGEEAYRRADGEELFHLDAALRGPGAEDFAPTGSVRLSARLATNLLPDLLAASTDPLDAGRRLGELSRAGVDTDLLRTESWYALAVTSPVELEPELAGSGSLRMGYATRWSSDGGALAPLRLGMVAIIEEVLDERGWEVEPVPEHDALRWRMTSACGTWSTYAIAADDDGLVSVYSLLDVTIAADRRGGGAVLVTRANHGLAVGNWELDMDDGAIRFKTSIDVTGDRLTIDLAHRLVERNLASVDAHLPALDAFARGAVTAREAFEMIAAGGRDAYPSSTAPPS